VAGQFRTKPCSWEVTMSTTRSIGTRQHVQPWLAEIAVFALVAAFALTVLSVAVVAIVSGA
jgi:hypothetical protein